MVLYSSFKSSKEFVFHGRFIDRCRLYIIIYLVRMYHGDPITCLFGLQV